MGPYDPKSPLKQFVTRITAPMPTGGGTRKWKCNICGTKWCGSINILNAHFLLLLGKGVGPCEFLKEAKTLHYRIQFHELWCAPNDIGVAIGLFQMTLELQLVCFKWHLSCNAYYLVWLASNLDYSADIGANTYFYSYIALESKRYVRVNLGTFIHS